jgi:hypothetical protein
MRIGVAVNKKKFSMTLGRRKGQIVLFPTGVFDSHYIFANFAQQFPEKQRGTIVDGGFLAAFYVRSRSDRQNDESAKQNIIHVEERP